MRLEMRDAIHIPQTIRTMTSTDSAMNQPGAQQPIGPQPGQRDDDGLAKFSRQVLASTEDIWGRILPGYRAPTLVLYDGVTDAGGCGTGPASPLPLLSIASELHVRNDCSGRATRVPVIECGCLAARFCDRCTRCGTSPRGRIVELTRTSFVDLGGDLDAGCFNVTARVDHS